MKPTDYRSVMLSGVLSSYAPDGQAALVVKEMQDEMLRDGVSSREQQKNFASAIANGLLYGNWPWGDGEYIEDQNSLNTGLCEVREDHYPHAVITGSLAPFWCHANQAQRLPYAAEVRRQKSRLEGEAMMGGPNG